MIARSNPVLKLNEYYASLWEFISHAPVVTGIINRIAARKGNEFDFQYMTVIKNMLKSIGCYKFITDINDIIQSGKMGHNGYSASCAKRLLIDINNFYIRLRKTEKTRVPEPVNGQTGESPFSFSENISLSRALFLLEQEESSRKMRILAIDDSPVMLQTISSLLGDDYTVYKMVNPAMLEKFLEKVTPELFLLDYKMPDMSGFDLIPIIRNFEEHKNTPIVFLTSEGTSDHVSSALTLGARDFIIKPFQPNILREKVAKHIVRKNLLQKKVA
jgi:PleD family two-component response regulator